MSCGIADTKNDVYFITGNNNSKFSKSVTVYDAGGWFQDLPELNIGRRNHACSGYYNDKKFVLVVVGGQADPQCREHLKRLLDSLHYLIVGRIGSALASTETLEVVGQSQWKIFENSLPHGLYTAKAITLNNKIYLMGINF